MTIRNGAFSKFLILVLAAMVITAIAYFLHSKFKKDDPEPDAVDQSAGSTEQSAAPAPSGPVTKKEKIRFVNLTVTAPDQDALRTLIKIVSSSAQWQEALYAEHRVSTNPKQPSELNLVAEEKPSQEETSWRIIAETVSPDGKTKAVISLTGSDLKPRSLKSAALKAAMDLLFFREPDTRKLERIMLKWFETAKDDNREVLRAYLLQLGKLGHFDSAMAARTVTPIPKERLVLKGKKELAEHAGKIVNDEPIWHLYMMIIPETVTIEIRSKVVIKPVRGGGSVIVIPGNYDPGEATVQVIITRGKVTQYSETGKFWTPGMVKSGQSPYLIAEQNGVYSHLMDAALRFAGTISPDVRRKHFSLLLLQLAKLHYRGKHHKIWEQELAKLAAGCPRCQYMLVSLFASKMHRMEDRSRAVLKLIGPSCVSTLVRGLSHHIPLVRSRCAMMLRSEGSSWYKPHTTEIVRRLTETLEDPDEKDSWPQALYLLRDIGPAAKPALPAIKRIIKEGQMSHRRSAEQAAMSIEGKN